MGNRAIIKFDGEETGIYLHWNGGRDSVEAFLEYCKLRNFRCDNYGVARMCQVVGNWFGGTLSIGTVANIKDEDSDWVDNGIYVVKNWEIIKRIPDDMEEQMYHDKIEMLLDIDNEQPERDRLGAQYINAPWVDTKDLKPGDKIYCRFHEDDRLSVEEVIGVHKHPSVDKEYPYIGHWTYCGIKDPTLNVNNYLTEPRYKVFHTRTKG